MLNEMEAPAPDCPPGPGAGAPSLTIAYLGNFQPSFEPHPWHQTPWSTETHVALSLESLGHRVVRLQEGEIRAVDVPARCREAQTDLFVWTQTFGLAETGGTNEERHGMLRQLRKDDIPSLGFHLDKWWDIQDGRGARIPTDAFFRCDLVATADSGGGRWQKHGINAVYSPPAIYHAEAVSGTYRSEFASPIAFVGSWRGIYHPEWTHRAELLDFLRRRWLRQTGFWPRGPQIRGAALSDLYASVKVVIGDSCALPGSMHHSDRAPETLGRGGFLLHPHIGGIEENYTDGQHLRLWTMGNWDELDALIRYYLAPAHEQERQRIAAAGQAHVRAHHTYRLRMERLLPIVLATRGSRVRVLA